MHKAILLYRHGSIAQGFYRPQMVFYRPQIVLFYLTRPLLLGEVPHPLLNTLASPKSFTLGNDQMNLSLLSLNQDFPLLRRKDLKPGRPGLYSQTSARPKGLLVIIYATES